MAGYMKRNSRNTLQQILPDDVMESLLTSATPIMPEKARADRLRSKVLSQVSAAQQTTNKLVTVREDEGKWLNVGPLVDMKVLQDDGATRSLLLRLHPGARLPAHDHPVDEVCIVLEGEGYIGGVYLRAGDYHFAPKGLSHGDSHTETGALLFITTTIRAPNYQGA